MKEGKLAPCAICTGGVSTEGPVDSFNRGSSRDQRAISAQERGRYRDWEVGISCRGRGRGSASRWLLKAMDLVQEETISREARMRWTKSSLR
jgi:hypothetical protein